MIANVREVMVYAANAITVISPYSKDLSKYTIKKRINAMDMFINRKIQPQVRYFFISKSYLSPAMYLFICESRKKRIKARQE